MPTRVWLPEIAERVASFLPPNIIACTFRLLDKASAEQFRDIREVQLSQPAPRWAFAEHWLSPEACSSLTLERRRQLVSLVAASGDVANLKIAIQAAGCQLTPSALVAAARAGALESCKCLAGMLSCWAREWPSVLRAAARGGHRAVCEWCLANGAQRSWQAVAAAYSGGHPELAELLQPEEEPDALDRESLLQGSAEGCDMAVLQAVWAAVGGVGQDAQRQSDSRRSAPLAAAVGSPTPDWQAKVEFLLAQGLPFCYTSANAAVRLPPDTALQRLEWLKARGCPTQQLSLDAAASAGNTAALRWMLAGGASCFISLLDGHRFWSAAPLEATKMLLEADEILPARAALGALRTGAQGLPVLRWLVDTYGPEVLHARGTEIDMNWETDGGKGVDAAAQAGCVGAMVLTHGHGLAFSKATWVHAAASGCEAAVVWLDQMGCPRPADGQPYAAAIRNGDVRTLGVLKRLGLLWSKRAGTRGLVEAVEEGGGGDALRWVVSQGWPLGWDSVREAAQERLQSGDAAAREVLACVERAAPKQPTGASGGGPGGPKQMEGGGRGGRKGRKGGSKHE